LVLNSDDDVSFLHVINSPKRGMGKSSLDRLQHQALHSPKSLYECLKEQVQQQVLKGKSLKECAQFINSIEELKNERSKISLYELYTLLLDRSGYIESLEMQKNMEAQSRIENLQEFGNMIGYKENRLKKSSLDLQDFLEEMSLLTDVDKTKDDKNSVTLMTLHNSKGLEFSTVFITGMEEGLFPSFQSVEDNNIEEERRLAYVGMTRAKDKLLLSYAKSRTVWGREQYNPPSQFLKEIKEDLVYYSHSSFLNS